MKFDSLLSELTSRRLGAKPFERLAELLKTSPSEAGAFAETALFQVPEGGTFFELALSLVTLKDFDRLIAIALDMINTSSRFEAAESVIAYASLQAPALLHPHLSRIFKLAPNQSKYYANWPWRESGSLARSELTRIVSSDPSEEQRVKAWKCLLETRFTPALDDALALAGILPIPQPAINYFLEVGYESPTRSLFNTKAYHIVFPLDYFAKKRPVWSDRALHPTWNLAGEVATCRFGGFSQGSCGRCNGQLHHLITLPAEVVPSDTTITLATCLSCLGYEHPFLAYRHDSAGQPLAIACGQSTPEFPAAALRETSVRLTPTPPRWQWQDWALSNNRENLCRVGGHPSWIQSADYPACPSCSERMKYLMQLDSDLTGDDGSEWLWGSGGICYGCWCGACRVSGFLWQCT